MAALEKHGLQKNLPRNILRDSPLGTVVERTLNNTKADLS